MLRNWGRTTSNFAGVRIKYICKFLLKSESKIYAQYKIKTINSGQLGAGNEQGMNRVKVNSLPNPFKIVNNEKSNYPSNKLIIHVLPYPLK